MIHSMTAFARFETKGDWGNLVWELRSINHRYLDVNLRLPETLSKLEPQLREHLRAKLQRGKIEISARFQALGTSTQQLAVNFELAQQLFQAHASLTKLTTDSTPLTATDILRWPGILQNQEADSSDLNTIFLDSFNAALTELVQVRAREGTAIHAYLLERLQAINLQITKVKQRLPDILQEHREKILHRIAEAKLTLESTRLEQEMVLLAQKIDIAEELSRLEMHCTEMEHTLQSIGANGRRLDFLLQELNREANTLGSKSNAVETTLAAVELKVLIEQMREQVQNIE